MTTPSSLSRLASRVSRLSGFTLIEMLVVLVLIGLVGSMVMPDLWSVYEKVHERNAVQEIASSIRNLRLDAFHSGRAVNLPAVTGKDAVENKFLPVLPNGWLLEKSTDIRLLSNGVTNGGELYLRAPGGSHWLLTLGPLDGRVKIRRL